MSRATDYVGIGAIAIGGLCAIAMMSAVVFDLPAAEHFAPANVAPSAMSGAATPASSPTIAQAPAAPASSPTAAAASPEPAAPVLPDPIAGKVVFGKCRSCHTVDAKAKSGVGPNLNGILNRPIASMEGYAYSKALSAKAGESWTPAALDQFLADVKASAKGTKMAFAGLPSAVDRANLIAFLAQNAAVPIAPADLGLGVAAAAGESTSAPEAAAPAPSDAAASAAAPVEAVQIAYRDPPPPSDDQIAWEEKMVAALKASLPSLDYERARHHPLHFKPAIDRATDGECLVCHREVLDTAVREESPAGLKSTASLAWYQTLATYDGSQMTFHQRHLASPYARSVMNLSCNFCHQGSDPREESPLMTVAAQDMTSNNGDVPFTNRKMVNTSQTCLLCHGAMPAPAEIMGLPAAWPAARVDLETEEQPNGCLTCHGELFRTNRHNVTYLRAAAIEELGKLSSDVCYGCHGGRAWYQNAYPYPRHPWPGMDPAVPDWAAGRPAESDPRYLYQESAQ